MEVLRTDECRCRHCGNAIGGLVGNLGATECVPSLSKIIVADEWTDLVPGAPQHVVAEIDGGVSQLAIIGAGERV